MTSTSIEVFRAMPFSLGSWKFHILFQTFIIVFTFLQCISPGVGFRFPDESREEREINCTVGTWYHNETQACYRSRQQGPCPDTMIYYKVDSKYGDCDCPMINSDVNGIGGGTEYVYDIASDQCFKMYEKAFCAAGEWLIFDETLQLVCAPNKCLKMQQEGSEEHNKNHPVVLYKNKCARLYNASPDGSCENPYTIIIDRATGVPICSSALIDNYDIGVKGSLRCRPGTRRDRLGKCRPLNSKVSLRPSSASAS